MADRRRVWIDVSDLADWTGPPTGIQRVVLSYAARLHGDPEIDTAFCAFEPTIRQFVEIPADVALTTVSAPRKYEKASARTSKVKLAYRRAVSKLPVLERVVNTLRTDPKQELMTAIAEPKRLFALGDHVIVLGANWLIAGYADHLAVTQAQLDLRVTHMVHDLIPTLHPQWAATGASEIVTPYLRTVLGVCANILTVSTATRSDLEALTQSDMVKLRHDCTIHTVVHGYDISALAEEAVDVDAIDVKAPPPTVDASRDFILCVGTVEIRKNHHVLYQAYRLAAERGIDLPMLYIVGRSGWLAAATEHLIEHDSAVNQRLRILRDVSDAQLVWLYEHCSFTVFPSLCEGWGLPITEALGRGKVCVTASNASLREAGGECANYVSPYDSSAWLEAILVFTDRQQRSVRESEIRQRYQVRTWDDAYADLRRALAL